MATIPLVRDGEVLYFKAIQYLQDYRYYTASRCNDASSYSDLLPEKLAKASGSISVISAVKLPPATRNKEKTAKATKKKMVTKHKHIQRKPKPVSKGTRKSNAPPLAEIVVIHSAAKIEILSDNNNEACNKFFYEGPSSQ